MFPFKQTKKHSRKLVTFLFLCLLQLCFSSEVRTDQLSGIQHSVKLPQSNFDHASINLFSHSGNFTKQISATHTEYQTTQQSQNYYAQAYLDWYKIMGIAVAGVLFLFLLIIAIKYVICRKNHQKQQQQSWYYVPQWRKYILSDLDKNSHAEYLKVIDGQEICTVCLHQNCNTITSCDHFYHLKCIASWFVHQASCPVCRATKFDLKYFCKRCTNAIVWFQSISDVKKCSKFLNEYPFCQNCHEMIKLKRSKSAQTPDKTEKQLIEHRGIQQL